MKAKKIKRAGSAVGRGILFSLDALASASAAQREAEEKDAEIQEHIAALKELKPNHRIIFVEEIDS